MRSSRSPTCSSSPADTKKQRSRYAKRSTYTSASAHSSPPTASASVSPQWSADWRSGAVARCGEDLLCLAAAVPAASLGPLRRLKILVALEEVLDLVAQLVRDVVDV